MKLFSNAELKDLKVKDQTKEVLRTQEMQKVADKTRKELANAERDFKLSLANFKDKWATEEQEHTARVREMKGEIKALEIQKKEAMQPVEELEKMAAKKLSDAVKMKDELKKSQDDIEVLTEILEEKLDGMADKSRMIEEVEIQLAGRERGIKMQELNTSQSAKEVSRRMADFLAQKQVSENDIQQRKETLFLKERSLLSKEEALKRTEKKLEEWSIRLKDERGVLDRIYERQKKGISP